MKKFLVAYFVFILSGPAYSQYALISTGGFVGFQIPIEIQWYNTEISSKQFTAVTYETKKMVNVGSYLDLYYFCFSAQYTLQSAPLSQTVDYIQPVPRTLSSEIETMETNIELTFLFKYPIVIYDWLLVFPSLGLEYDLNIFYYGKEKMSSHISWDISDIYFIGGAGLDIYLAKGVYLRPMVKVGINLTSTPSISDSNTKYFGFKTDFGLSLGFDIS